MGLRAGGSHRLRARQRAAGGRHAPAAAEEEGQFGAAYAQAKALRSTLDRFKNQIDAMQKLMDRQMKLRVQRVKARKDEAAAALVAELTQQIDASEVERAEAIAAMRQLQAQIVSGEAAYARLQQEAPPADDAEPKPTPATAATEESADAATPVPYAGAMDECLEAYATVEAKRQPLQELAADATRKYKSPLFSRMKELLADMKQLKKSKE
ncbi:hypothetical protein STCU_11128 [Strigomonas culicis]|uniref:Uncharacterized protein n=1 Tax=Strigomonas culicis TaxID=28005 RepID=S9UPN1_9TRYP|nr:hypothetical protein STCU_11128 [Strigomonas culicis]|eukprot:EPY16581.1 hypothetical protein STCU_11128 [Strigomonas culicis]